MPSDPERLDVTRVDGPHSPERTEAVGRLIADAVRYLNYATMPADGAPGIGYAGDADNLLGSIAAAVGGLQQLLGQIGQCLRDDLATGRLRLDVGRPYAEEPAKAVAAAVADLEVARAEAAQLQAALVNVRRITAGMYLESTDE
jgi:hypothetical protein